MLALLIFVLPLSVFAEKKIEAPKRQIETPRLQRLNLKPDYSSGRSLMEEPLQVQKELPSPQKSGNIYAIQKKVLKEVGASETQIKQATEGAETDESHSMD